MRTRARAAALVLLAVSCTVPALLADQPAVRGAAAPGDLESAWDARCADPGAPACTALRALMIDRLLGDLEVLESSSDRRAAEGAREVIAIDDPDVQAAAIRILVKHWGPAPSDYAGEVAPLLMSEIPRIQRMAALALGRSAEAGARGLAEEWRWNHKELDDEAADLDTPYVSPDPARRRFKAYPGARPFPPADNRMSIGFATPDPADKVLAFYRTPDSEEAMGPSEFYQAASGPPPEGLSEEQQAAVEKEAEAIGREMEAAMQGGKVDAAAMQKANEKMAALQQKLVAAVTPPPGILDALPQGAIGETSRFQIVERREDRVVRAVMASPSPVLGLTIVRLLSDPGETR